MNKNIVFQEWSKVLAEGFHQNIQYGITTKFQAYLQLAHKLGDCCSNNNNNNDDDNNKHT